MKTKFVTTCLAIFLSLTAFGSVSAASQYNSGGTAVVYPVYSKDIGFAIFKHQDDPSNLQIQFEEWLKANPNVTVVSTQLQQMVRYYVLSVVYRK
ncbi:MAG: hypothetical protein K2Z81_27030 [Cyanobacteria bacterium]|nr:hypothetical protein [Cyanobacteriota bacterium]